MKLTQTETLHLRIARQLLLALFFLIGATHTPSAFASDAPLQPGDELIILLPGGGANAERTVTIDENGEVGLGIYGHVRLAGMDPEQALRALKSHLSEFIRATDGVYLTLSKRQMLVFVTGQVESPGLATVPPSSDAWTAIRSAGGLLDGANLGGTVILRNGQEIVVDIQAYLTRESTEPLPQLLPGDTIFVPAQPGLPTGESAAGAFLSSEVLRSKIFVIGAVGAAGVYDRPPGLTPLGALAVAGGPTEAADLAGCRIITASRTSAVDLAGIIAGEVADSNAYFDDGGAILFVPNRMEGASSRFVDGIAVMGAVASPGNIEIGGAVPLTEALSLAGGPTPDAVLRRIRHVRHEDGATLAHRYNLRRYVNHGGLLATVTVEPGDALFVPGRSSSGWTSFMDVVSDLAVISSAVAFYVTLANGN